MSVSCSSHSSDGRSCPSLYNPVFRVPNGIWGPVFHWLCLSAIYSKRVNKYFSKDMQKKPTIVTDLFVFAARCKRSCLAKVTVLKILMPAFLKTEFNFCQVLPHLLNSCVWGWPCGFSLCFHCQFFCLDKISYDQFLSLTVEIIHCTDVGAQKKQLWRWAGEYKDFQPAHGPLCLLGAGHKRVCSVSVSALALTSWCNYCWELLTRQNRLQLTVQQVKFQFKLNHPL